MNKVKLRLETHVKWTEWMDGITKIFGLEVIFSNWLSLKCLSLIAFKKDKDGADFD